MILRSIVCVHFMRANTNIVRGSRKGGGGGKISPEKFKFLKFYITKNMHPPPPRKIKNPLEPPHPLPPKKDYGPAHECSRRL